MPASFRKAGPDEPDALVIRGGSNRCHVKVLCLLSFKKVGEKGCVTHGLSAEKILPRIEFDSYEDFKENYKVNVPEDFNFGFDVVDAWAKEEPEKKALVWCDEQGDELTFTFTDIMRLLQ